MGWNDVRDEANKPQESRYLNLNDGDKLTLQIIGQPTLNSRVSKRTGDPFKVVVFQVLEPRSEKAKTLELFPSQVQQLTDLQDTHPATEWDYIVERIGRHVTWTPVEREAF